jgi:hypothetical protein
MSDRPSLPQPQYEARLYADLRASNPHLPEPGFVTHGFQLDTAETGIPVIKLAVYVQIPDHWLAAVEAEVPSE